MTATGWGVQNEDSDTAATNLREVCILIKVHLTVVSLHNKLTVCYVCIVTTDSGATDFAKELQKEAIWRGGNAEHDVCNRGQCRDMLRKRSVDILLELREMVNFPGRFRRSSDV